MDTCSVTVTVNFTRDCLTCCYILCAVCINFEYFLSVGYFHVKMLMSAWWGTVGVQRCATTQREISSAAAFYQAMKSERTVLTVLVCKMAELSRCMSN